MGQFVEDMPGHVRDQPVAGRPISVFDMQPASADDKPAEPVKQAAKAVDPEGSKK